MLEIRTTSMRLDELAAEKPNRRFPDVLRKV
jgi:hypothetical protein